MDTVRGQNRTTFFLPGEDFSVPSTRLHLELASIMSIPNAEEQIISAPKVRST
jgi:hypothetical protein